VTGRIVSASAPCSVAVVTIDRPAKRNALTPEMFVELAEVFEALDQDADIRACVLTGAGENFSAGGDIEAFTSLVTDGDRQEQVERAFRAFRAIESVSVPVIAAVDGVAHGGGTELAFACDLVLASSRATFALPEVTVSLMPGFGLARAIPQLGPQRAAALALTGNTITAERACSWGLVLDVVAPGELQSEAMRLAAEIASRPPAAVRAIKAFVARSREPDRLADAARSIVGLFATEDHRRAITAWAASKRRSLEDVAAFVRVKNSASS
jgi:enoyl-CoA hydratase/carnithine racemase